MNEEHKELLSAYLDGETTAEEGRVVEELLRRDQEARVYLDDITRIAALLRTLPIRQAPPSLSAGLRQDHAAIVPHKPAGRVVSLFSRRWVSYAAAACLVVVTGVSVYVFFGRGESTLFRPNSGDYHVAVSPEDPKANSQTGYERGGTETSGTAIERVNEVGAPPSAPEPVKELFEKEGLELRRGGERPEADPSVDDKPNSGELDELDKNGLKEFKPETLDKAVSDFAVALSNAPRLNLNRGGAVPVVDAVEVADALRSKNLGLHVDATNASAAHYFASLTNTITSGSPNAVFALVRAAETKDGAAGETKSARGGRASYGSSERRQGGGAASGRARGDSGQETGAAAKGDANLGGAPELPNPASPPPAPAFENYEGMVLEIPEEELPTLILSLHAMYYPVSEAEVNEIKRPGAQAEPGQNAAKAADVETAKKAESVDKLVELQKALRELRTWGQKSDSQAPSGAEPEQPESPASRHLRSGGAARHEGAPAPSEDADGLRGESADDETPGSPTEEESARAEQTHRAEESDAVGDEWLRQALMRALAEQSNESIPKRDAVETEEEASSTQQAETDAKAKAEAKAKERAAQAERQREDDGLAPENAPSPASEPTPAPTGGATGWAPAPTKANEGDPAAPAQLKELSGRKVRLFLRIQPKR